jgi:hypothetical protein
MSPSVDPVLWKRAVAVSKGCNVHHINNLMGSYEGFAFCLDTLGETEERRRLFIISQCRLLSFVTQEELKELEQKVRELKEMLSLR